MRAPHIPLDIGSPPKSVVIWAGAYLNWLWIELARQFKEVLDAEVHFICGTKSDEKWYRAQDKANAVKDYTLTDWTTTDYGRVRPSPEDVVAARSIEKEYGLLFTDILQADRRLSLGYSSSGRRYPHAWDHATYEDSLSMFVRAARCWKSYFVDHRPDLVICTPGCMASKLLCAMARAIGIPLRNLTWSHYKDFYYWSSDEYFTFPRLEAEFEKTDDEALEEPDYSRLRAWDEESRLTYFYERTLIKSLASIAKASFYHIYRRVIRSRTFSYKEFFRTIGWLWRDYRLAKTLPDRLAGSEVLKDKDFVLYPLGVEPESTYSIATPEFNDQLSLIYQVAKSLPAGVYLAVKEHYYFMASRPKGFYNQIETIPNVVLLSPSVDSIVLAKRSLATLVISSTLGSEAASLGVPILSFNLHNFYNFLPHVYLITDHLQLRKVLSELFSWQDPESIEQRRKYGRRFINSIKAVSVDCARINFAYLSKRRVAGQSETDLFFTTLIDSLKANSSTIKETLARRD